MSRSGIRINDWFSQICAGVFFFCIGVLFLSFISGDVSALNLADTSDLIGLVIFLLIPLVFSDLGLVLVIGGWRMRKSSTSLAGFIKPAASADGGVVTEEQKAVQAVTTGISAVITVTTWIQRITFAAAAIFAVIVTGFLLLTSAKMPGGMTLLMWGIVLASYVVILLYYLVLKRPREN